MKKYYYIMFGMISVALLITLIILSYIDRTVLSPSKASREASAPEKEGGSNRQSPPQPFSPAYTEAAPGSAAVPAGTEGSISSPTLSLRLIGTTVFGEKSTAVLEDLVRGGRGIYRLKDSVRGYTITAIDKESVTLTADGRSYVLTRSPDIAQPDGDSFFTKIDDNSWLVSADKAADMVSNIDQYAGQVIAFQHRENGQPAGFKIRHLQDGNDFEKLGFENNDIIKRVNGLEVKDLTDVMKAVYELGNETEFTIEVERGNEIQDLNYRLDRNVNALVPIIARLLNIQLSAVGVR